MALGLMIYHESCRPPHKCLLGSVSAEDVSLAALAAGGVKDPIQYR